MNARPDLYHKLFYLLYNIHGLNSLPAEGKSQGNRDPHNSGNVLNLDNSD